MCSAQANGSVLPSSLAQKDAEIGILHRGGATQPLVAHDQCRPDRYNVVDPVDRSLRQADPVALEIRAMPAPG
jgi:hypothetical protein